MPDPKTIRLSFPLLDSAGGQNQFGNRQEREVQIVSVKEPMGNASSSEQTFSIQGQKGKEFSELLSLSFLQLSTLPPPFPIGCKYLPTDGPDLSTSISGPSKGFPRGESFFMQLHW